MAQQRSTIKPEGHRSTAVYDTIREMAIEYRFRPDEKINEAELAKRLGVSRTPVREALNRLLNEGLIHFHKNRGFHCRSLSATDLFFLAESRRNIEVSMLEQVIARASDADLAELHAMCKTTHKSVGLLPPCELARADEAFHSRLASLTCNTVLVELLRNVNARIRFMCKIRIEDKQIRKKIFREHIDILEAIQDRDVARAQEKMTQHLVFTEEEAASVIKEGLGKIYLDKIYLDVNLTP